MTLTLDIDGRRVARHSVTVNNKSVNETVGLYTSGAITIEQADEARNELGLREGRQSCKNPGNPDTRIAGSRYGQDGAMLCDSISHVRVALSRLTQAPEFTVRFTIISAKCCQSRADTLKSQRRSTRHTLISQ